MTSSTPRNIEIFDQVTAYTLIKLYECFPVPQNLCHEDIHHEITKACTDENEAFQIYTNYIASTILFLSDEKFIQYDQNAHSHSQYFNVRLTLRGLTLLGTVPNALNNNQSSFIELLKESFKKGAETAVSSIVKLLMTYGSKNIFDNIST